MTEDMKIQLQSQIINLEITDEMMEKINQQSPLKTLSPDDVFIRAMKLTGNQINSQRGRFRDEDLPMLAAKTIGAPVLIGHQKESRPIAKFFDGHVQDFGEQGQFTVNSFFFPSGRSDADDLALDIDAGILSEASISFQCRKLTCSECGNDIRTTECRHRLEAENDIFYFYDKILNVLEGSIVFRGAHPNTGMVPTLMDLSVQPEWEIVFNKPIITTAIRQRQTIQNGIIIEREVI